jgi:hypothetical protein
MAESGEPSAGDDADRRADAIAERFSDGLSRDALKDLAGDIAAAIREGK